jgi:hypothetical protein
MRTTLSLEDDVIQTIQSYAREHGVSLGKAASELIRRGSRYQLGIRTVNGLPVLDAPEDFPPVTTKRIRELLDEE